MKKLVLFMLALIFFTSCASTMHASVKENKKDCTSVVFAVEKELKKEVTVVKTVKKYGDTVTASLRLDEFAVKDSFESPGVKVVAYKDHDNYIKFKAITKPKIIEEYAYSNNSIDRRAFRHSALRTSTSSEVREKERTRSQT